MKTILALVAIIIAFPRKKYNEAKEEIRDFVVLIDEEYSNHLYI